MDNDDRVSEYEISFLAESDSQQHEEAHRQGSRSRYRDNPFADGDGDYRDEEEGGGGGGGDGDDGRDRNPFLEDHARLRAEFHDYHGPAVRRRRALPWLPTRLFAWRPWKRTSWAKQHQDEYHHVVGDGEGIQAAQADQGHAPGPVPSSSGASSSSPEPSLSDQRIPGATWYQAKTPQAVISVLAIMLFLLVLALSLAVVPMMRLIEDAVCREHYGISWDEHPGLVDDEHAPPDERKCKVDDVQSQMAWVGGVVAVSESILGLVLSVPWAFLADRIGRKPVLRVVYIGAFSGMGYSSLVLLRRDAISIWWLMGSIVFLLVGGGAGVIGTILHAIVSDVMPHSRAAGFIGLTIGAVLGHILGPSLAALMMGVMSPWFPICIALFGLAPLSMLLISCVPETLKKKDEATAVSAGQFRASNLTDHLAHTWTRLSSSLRILRRSRPALLLLPCFLLQNPVNYVQAAILAQSVSKRFGWSLAQTGYLFSAKGLVTVVVLAFLPWVSGLLVRQKKPASAARGRRLSSSLFQGVGLGPVSFRVRATRFASRVYERVADRLAMGLSEPAKDLLVARVSIGFQLLGSLLMAAGSLSSIMAGLVVTTLAVGLSPSGKSLITHYYADVMEHEPVAADSDGGSDSGLGASPQEGAKEEYTSRLYTVVHMVETSGSLLAGPVVAWMFSLGLRLGGIWTGLPFFYVAMLCAVALFCLLLIPQPVVRKPTAPQGGQEDDEDEEEEVGPGSIAIV